MEKLKETFDWASSVEIGHLRRAIRQCYQSPLLAVGSGGSLSAAYALAAVHRISTKQLTSVATPLEAAAEPLDKSVTPWLISAGGSNTDIRTAFKSIVAREPRRLVVLTGKAISPLSKMADQHSFVEKLVFSSPAGKDGFLATNSLLAFVTLIYRAYTEELQKASQWADVRQSVQELLTEEYSNKLRTLLRPIWKRDTTVVLYGVDARVGAIDLESKFTEAALGNLQLADYRNFAHGRHHWLAKRGKSSAIIALVSKADEAIARSTLKLIPKNIPTAVVKLPGDPTSAAIGSLIAAFRIAGYAGQTRDIDPGQPGVPTFGRRLYSLQAPLPQNLRKGRLPYTDIAALERKSGFEISELENRNELTGWLESLGAFKENISRAKYSALVLDYDGTIVDTKDRFDPPIQGIVTQLTRILEAGIKIGFATGRGKSVREALRTSIAEHHWSSIFVGYYNGAEIISLDDERLPDGSDIVCEALQPIERALSVNKEISLIGRQTNRKFQITIESKTLVEEKRLWELVQQVLLKDKNSKANITRSSHSVDIVAPGVSKERVIDLLRDKTDQKVLAIGDRGRWPGNDFELLRGPYSLSVDEVSDDPASCWNLTSRGLRGVEGTMEYFRRFATNSGVGTLDFQFEK